MNRTLQALYALLPIGAAGISAALATAPAEASSIAVLNPEHAQPEQAQSQNNVAARLQSIRAGVTALSTEPAGHNPDILKAWWHNGGWGWHNGGGGFGWHNGGWGWHNGGWGNGGWGNGGWHNGGWGNGWHNGWHNGWGNW